MLAIDDSLRITYDVCNHSSTKSSGHGIALGQPNVPSADALVEISLKDHTNLDAVTRYRLKQVPLFLIHALEEMTTEAALKTVGLFRKEANRSKMNLDLEALFTWKLGLPQNLNAVDVSVLIKRFFRMLQKPLIYNPDLERRLIKLSSKKFSEITREEFCTLFVPNSPHDKASLEASHLGTLGYLMIHLQKVSAVEHIHKMSSSSLATVFAPNLFPVPDDGISKPKRGKSDDLIINHKRINDARIKCIEMLIVKGNWIGQPVTPYLSSENKSRSSSAAAPLVRKYFNSCAKVLPLKNVVKEKPEENTKLKETKESNRRSSSSFGVLLFGGRKEKSSKGVPHRRQTLGYMGKRRSSPSAAAINFQSKAPDQLQFADSPPSASRLSRSEQQRRCRVVTPVNNEMISSPKSPKAVPNRRLTDVSNTRPHNKPNIVRSETYTGPHKQYRDPTISLLGSDVFDETSRKQKQPLGRRRHTAPIKANVGLRRDAPNTVNSGLPLPKRRPTVILREGRDSSSEIACKRRSLSTEHDPEQPSSSDAVDQSVLDSSLLLEQRGYESRLRRTRLRSGKSLAMNSTIESVYSKEIAPESPSGSLTPAKSKYGSAIVGPSQVIVEYMTDNSPKSDVSSRVHEENLYVPGFSSMDSQATCAQIEVKDVDATISISEDKKNIQSPKVAAKSAVPDSPRFRVPQLPVFKAPPLISQKSLDSQLSKTQVSMNDSFPVDPRIVARIPSGRYLKPPLPPKPIAPKSTNSKNNTVTAAKNVGRISLDVDDDDFSFSNDMKSQILGCADPEAESHARVKGTGMRPSVAHIQANNPGRVKGMVRQINSINQNETLSGRSSAMSSRGSLGDQSELSSEFGGRMSGPPLSHNLTTRLAPRHSYPSPLKK